MFVSSSLRPWRSSLKDGYGGEQSGPGGEGEGEGDGEGAMNT